MDKEQLIKELKEIHLDLEDLYVCAGVNSVLQPTKRLMKIIIKLENGNNKR